MWVLDNTHIVLINLTTGWLFTITFFLHYVYKESLSVYSGSDTFGFIVIFFKYVSTVLALLYIHDAIMWLYLSGY